MSSPTTSRKARPRNSRDRRASLAMLATIEADPTKDYDQGDATGFIRLNAPRLKVAAKVQRKNARGSELVGGWKCSRIMQNAKIDVLLWALPVGLSLHVFEEFAVPGGFSQWINANSPRKPKSNFYYFLVNALGIVAAIIIALKAKDILGFRLYLYAVAIMAGNAATHIRGTIRNKAKHISTALLAEAKTNCVVNPHQRHLFPQHFHEVIQARAGGIAGAGEVDGFHVHTGNCRSNSLWLPIHTQIQTSPSNRCATAR
jgi:hypothetical protein